MQKTFYQKNFHFRKKTNSMHESWAGNNESKMISLVKNKEVLAI